MAANPSRPPAALAPALSPRLKAPARWRVRRAFNWQLLLGALLVAFIVWLAVAGPGLAPRDPMQENFILLDQATGHFVKPPYAPGQMPGFPLGADRWGRDIFSMLLWAVRPTLVMVLMVATVRLAVGTLVGLAAGWFDGRLARFLDSLIGLALSVPVFFVALAVIAAVGVNLGLWAFILGLCATGWGEVARLVRVQTRTVRGQPFVEAAHALGGEGAYVVGRHILPQIMPLLWNLLALEASSALMVAAGLGFIGYYVNAIWIPYGDFHLIQATGRPELGQMLAGARDLRQQPWSMLSAGALVAVMVLGFNLLGEGLRLALAPGAAQRRDALGRTLAAASHWLEDNFYAPLAFWRAIDTAVPALVLAVILGGGFLYWRAENQAEAHVAVSVPGGHLWASERHDAHGTAWANVTGPRAPVVAWEYFNPAGLSGGPAVNAEGFLYIASYDAQLHALAPNGQVLWSTALPEPPIGAPALGASGTVYVADNTGGLVAVSTDGVLLWRIRGNGYPALTGPITTPDETILYATQNALIGAQANGQLRWAIGLPSYSYSYPQPRLALDGQRFYFEDVTLDVATGDILAPATALSADRYILGVNGRTYVHLPGGLTEQPPASPDAAPAEPISETELDVRLDLRTLNLGGRAAANAGVLGDGGTWFLFASPFEFDRIIWVAPGAAVGQPMDYPYRQGWLAGIDAEAIAYQCGLVERGVGLECRANRLGSNQALWLLKLGVQSPPVGGALIAGRLYVAGMGGELYALEDAP